MVTEPEENRRIALYLRVANSLRQRIVQGEWERGAQIPTIERLTTEYDVSRITVRQALALLARDGLIGGARGRGTFVAEAVRAVPGETGLRAAINDPLEIGEGLTIEMLSVTRPPALPDCFAPDRGPPRGFVHIRKLHVFNTEPFALSEVAVPQAIYQRFPRGAERREKVLKLLLVHGGVHIGLSRQEITVSFADGATAGLLKCVLMAPLVKIRSWRHDDADTLVFATVTLYRGDRFIYDIVERETDFHHSRTLVIPTTTRRPDEEG